MSRTHALIWILILLAGQTAWTQQNPNGILPLHTTNQPYLFLVRDPAVHRDLQLTDQQLRELTKLNDRVDIPMWSMRNKTPQHVAKTMQESTAETQKALASIFNKEQNERLQQIELWVLGMKSLLRDDVAQQTGLTPEKQSAVRDIIQGTQRKLQGLQDELNNGGDATQLNKQYRQLQVDQQQQIISLLTPEQKQRWAAMLGRKIDVSKLGRIKFRAPELQSSTAWVNSEPLTMEQLKGKVVALHFYAFA